MNHILTFSIAIVLAAGAFTPAEAKKKDKDKDRDDKDRVVYVQPDRDRDLDRYDRRDRTRTIYVIERNRPVERVVYVDSPGRYYRWSDGRRIYVTGRHYDSFPERYYYRDGRPRITVTLPF